MRNKSFGQYYVFIDGMRAIAILLVIFHHIFYFFCLYRIFPRDSFIGKIAFHGDAGVNLFFVISGFLITGVIFQNSHEPIRIFRFYQRRFFKIYPQYLVCFLFCLGLPQVFSSFYSGVPLDSSVYVSTYDVQPKAVLQYLVFLQNYTAENLPMFGHSWSLAVEEHFYLIYPLLLGGVWSLVPSSRRMFVLAILFAVFIAGIASYRFFSTDADLLSVLTGAKVPAQTSLMCIDALMAGCLLKVLEPFLRKLPSGRGGVATAAGIFLAVVYFYGAVPERFGFLILWCGAVLLMAGGLIGWRPWNSLLENRWMKFIGRNSYGLYLWHYPLIFLVTPLEEHMKIRFVVLVYLILLFVLGVGSTKTIEYFSLRLRDKVAP